ncbi:MAG: hypothetical protein Q7K42_05770, partial [Candidatus Diapherotrites archaeon]|nr:hypothetical protein [Candidatus Diapherotrites archaeon]
SVAFRKTELDKKIKEIESEIIQKKLERHEELYLYTLISNPELRSELDSLINEMNSTVQAVYNKHGINNKANIVFNESFLDRLVIDIYFDTDIPNEAMDELISIQSDFNTRFLSFSEKVKSKLRHKLEQKVQPLLEKLGQAVKDKRIVEEEADAIVEDSIKKYEQEFRQWKKQQPLDKKSALFYSLAFYNILWLTRLLWKSVKKKLKK